MTWQRRHPGDPNATPVFAVEHALGIWWWRVWDDREVCDVGMGETKGGEAGTQEQAIEAALAVVGRAGERIEPPVDRPAFLYAERFYRARTTLEDAYRAWQRLAVEWGGDSIVGDLATILDSLLATIDGRNVGSPGAPRLRERLKVPRAWARLCMKGTVDPRLPTPDRIRALKHVALSYLQEHDHDVSRLLADQRKPIRYIAIATQTAFPGDYGNALLVGLKPGRPTPSEILARVNNAVEAALAAGKFAAALSSMKAHRRVLTNGDRAERLTVEILVALGMRRAMVGDMVKDATRRRTKRRQPRGE